MSEEFRLNDSQVNKLKEITSDGKANFAAGYDYLREQIQVFINDPANANSPDVQAYRKTTFWLENAAQINRNDADSQSNVFIRSVTESGLLFDGKDASLQTQQRNSDLIGRNVIRNTLENKRLQSVSNIIAQDAIAATRGGGQSLAGWGGAFYYWNTPMSSLPGDTVGNRILGNSLEYEKFVSVTAKAVLETAAKTGINIEQVLTGLDAQAPATLKAAIVNRALDYLDGTINSFAGDPNRIDSYAASIGLSGEVSWYQLDKNLKRIQVNDPAKIAELNARREIRLEKGVEHAWQQLASGQADNIARMAEIKRKTVGSISDENRASIKVIQNDGYITQIIKNGSERIEVVADKETGKQVSATIFDRHDRKTSDVRYNPDGSSIQSKYDSDTGQVTSSTTIGVDKSRTTKTFNSLNEVIREQRYDASGKVTYDSGEHQKQGALPKKNPVANSQATAKADADRLASEQKKAADEARKQAETEAAAKAGAEPKADEEKAAEQKRKDAERAQLIRDSEIIRQKQEASLKQAQANREEALRRRDNAAAVQASALKQGTSAAANLSDAERGQLAIEIQIYDLEKGSWRHRDSDLSNKTRIDTLKRLLQPGLATTEARRQFDVLQSQYTTANQAYREAERALKAADDHLKQVINDQAAAKAEAERRAAEDRAAEQATAKADADRLAAEHRIADEMRKQAETEAAAKAEAGRKAAEERAVEQAAAKAETERLASEQKAVDEARTRANEEQQLEAEKRREQADTAQKQRDAEREKLQRELENGAFDVMKKQDAFKDMVPSPTIGPDPVATDPGKGQGPGTAETERLAAEQKAAEEARKQAEREAAAKAEAERKEKERIAAESARAVEEQHRRAEEARKQREQALRETQERQRKMHEQWKREEDERKRQAAADQARRDAEAERLRRQMDSTRIPGSGGGKRPAPGMPTPGGRPILGPWIGVPVVLDLNGDGVLDIGPLGSVQGATASTPESMAANVVHPMGIGPAFDWDGDGVVDETAWVGPQDGLLVIDLAADGAAGADGKIDLPCEVAFALWKTEDERQAELKAQGIDDTGRPVTDLEGLRYAFDSNGDTILDANDTRWSEFRVWQDHNQNGVADDGELRTLDDVGIKFINLLPSPEGAKAFADGSAITGTSTAQKVDGTSILVGDVSLAFRPSVSG